ncbi:hypothetical protein [Chitinophaga sp. CF418]|uniref:hypothetical protein n=1 Tax=Chitinophaga sp. CF418 TaxID=1855287 RepID=UPI000915E0E9|nr:hypothetical protein [Chitinophaga sp. CF418]SHN23054.1 hypothetical protein SAMN05216311_107118 [Chitinophaga sp. CF418]
MRPIICFLLIFGIACNSPIKSKKQMDADSSSSIQEGANQSATADPSQNAAGGTANAGSAHAAGEEDANVTKGGTEPVSSTLRFKDHKYAIVSKGDGSGRSLTIAATNLKGDSTKADSTVIRDVKGMLQKTVIEDLNNDRNPEIYLFTTSAGTDATGSVYGITYINNKPVRIFSGDFDDPDKEGYRGRDSFYIQQHQIVRVYPAYKDSDLDSKPSGGKRTIKYTLQKQTNGFILRAAK